jgi:hypothetical protein
MSAERSLTMYKIEALPASYGDCLWIEYGDSRDPSRILIDCGVAGTYARLKERIEELPKAKRRFELLVISHVDNDHIEAAIKLLGAKSLGVTFDEVWFNGWKQIHPPDTLGPLEGEAVSALIERRKIPLNESLCGEAVFVPDSGPLPAVKLPGGMEITLLSPTRDQLDALVPVWKQALSKQGLTAGDSEEALELLAGRPKYADTLGAEGPDVDELADAEFKEDDSPANGASIAFVAQFGKKRCLFGGDAFPSVLTSSVERLLEQSDEPILPLGALKISHHGSRHNTTAELLRLVQCQTYLFSTDGKRFRHPNPEAVARVIVHGGAEPEMHFNYRSKFNSIWDDADLMSKHEYRAFFPEKSNAGCDLTL